MNLLAAAMLINLAYNHRDVGHQFKRQNNKTIFGQLQLELLEIAGELQCTLIR
jgi:hypothetical protein